MKMLHGIGIEKVLLAALASANLSGGLHAGGGEAPTAVLGFAKHDGCDGAPLSLHIGTKTIRGHVCQGIPDQAFLDLVHDFGMFLEVLPVEELERISISAAWIDVGFRGKEARKVTLHGQRNFALAPADERRPLDHGKLYRNEVEDATLRVASTLRLLRDAEGGIRGVRSGDLAVKCLGWFEVDLKTRRAPDRMAEDEDGRILLVSGPDGRPLMDENGRYVAQVFDCWMVVTIDVPFKDRKLTVGVPPAPDRVVETQVTLVR